MRTPEFNDDWFNPNADLPYGVEPDEIRTAIEQFYAFYADLNQFLMREDHGRIETVLRANNALSDFIGNVATEELAQASDSLIINQKQDGFPDILPIDNETYADQAYEIHHGGDGIETKCSKSSGGWQAHNNEEAWFIVFRYERGDPEDEIDEMDPIRLVQVHLVDLLRRLRVAVRNSSNTSSGTLSSIRRSQMRIRSS
ncbi:hypothetical protein BRD20_04400 [Halobacteriales archaeon SW_8_65_20]|nr:MAG: hypothetical protein BRD20_04400 [Halobacteriales archaeon SW_8_65_20]